MPSPLVVLCLSASVSSATLIPLATWDGKPGTTFDFKELNDPVMGGQSEGTFSVVTADSYGIFDGEVKDVPSLKAPGFIKAAADGNFTDVAAALGGNLVLTVRSNTSTYTGFKVSFAAGTLSPSYACAGGGSIALSRGCFKANFSVPVGDAWSTVRVPFTDFSDLWSPATGQHTKECSEDASACPAAKNLEKIERIELWGEGALGRVHLEVKSVAAETSSAATAAPLRPPAKFDGCKAPVQPQLLFNISSRMDTIGGGSAGESLAESVCCDTRNKYLAEPQFLFEAPDIQFFARLGSGVTTFYDAVCGVPLFRAPTNRTMAEFKADTMEHGWPSFRPAEVVKEHVTYDSDGVVTSSCGTHLGSYLPDAKGPRWCIDLSCVAGHEKSE